MPHYEIDTLSLRLAIDLILKHLETKHQTRKFSINADYYWEVSADVRYALDKSQVDNLVVGQLTDDWERIEQIANGSIEVLSWDLISIATLLRYLGETEVS